MGHFSSTIVAVTGAGNGIGRAVALQLADEGAILGLMDCEAGALEATARQCRNRGVRVVSQSVDLTDFVATQAFAETLADFAGPPDAIFNIAGVLYNGTVAATPAEDFTQIIDTNLRGVIHGTKAFLPYVERSSCGHIVNVSSAFGLITAPGCSAYSATKYAVRGFTEALRMELRGAPVSVTCVFPGGVRTAIAARAGAAPGVDRARFVSSFAERVARTSPDVAAAAIVRGAARGSRTVLVGADARVAVGLSRLPGGGYEMLVNAIAGQRDSSDS